MPLNNQIAKDAIIAMSERDYCWVSIVSSFNNAGLHEMLAVLVFMIQNHHAISNSNDVARFIYTKYSPVVDFRRLSCLNNEFEFAKAIRLTISKTVDNDTIPEAMAKALIDIYFSQ
jgi:hypothetical protein